ncbi:hypothetical protein J3R83DRAFT_1767 [Lanmaoa asiatica]|nr:hypothetical protein J3R83DRAFT_1767 [Lanmaoa asiatica]
MSGDGKEASAIIFGGLNTFSRALAALLVPPQGHRLVSHLRIVDKFSVSPPTTYLGAEFPNVLSQPDVEYRQVNLTVPTAVASAFDPPPGKAPYSYVFDLTGEVNHDRGEVIAIKLTFTVARIIALEAAKRSVKAYVRLQQPVYESPDKGPHDEKEDVKPTESSSFCVAALFMVHPLVITVASVYGYMKKPMKTIWGPGKEPVHTVHVEDVAGALWACAVWINQQGREQANTLAGEKIPFHNEKSKAKEVDGVVSPDEQPIAPLFNLVDDSETTLAKGGSMITKYFGTTFEFYSNFETTIAKLKMDDLVEEINEHHVGTWTEMLQHSNPPITHTPLTAYMDKFALSKHKLAYNNGKIKSVVGYQLKRPSFDHETLREVVEKWKEEGTWPRLDGQ